jgi:hypothetical protein
MRLSVSTLAFLVFLTACGGSGALGVPQSGGATLESSAAQRAALQSAAIQPAAATTSDVYVFTNKNTVQKFSDEGVAVGTGPFTGITTGYAVFDPKNKLIYVLENGWTTPSVVAYSLAGVEQTLSGGFPNLPHDSNAIIYDSQNAEIYVGGDGNPGAVTAYDASGTQQTLGGSFSGQSGVTAMTYDSSNGNIYIVSPNSSPTVLAYTASGEPVSLSGSFSGLDNPGAIEYDSNDGYLYITSLNTTTFGNNILAYTDQGSQVTLSPGFPTSTDFTFTKFDPVNDLIYTISQPNSVMQAYDEQGNLQTLTGTFKLKGHKTLADDYVVTY